MNGLVSFRFIKRLSRFPRKLQWIVMVALLGGLVACQQLPQAKVPAANRADGKPFPLGIYGVPGVADLQAVHASGFSLVMGGLDPAYMDAAARLGLGVIAAPGSSAGKGFNAKRVRETVRRWDRHPALSGWYLIDEPDLNEVPAEQVEQAHNAV